MREYSFTEEIAKKASKSRYLLRIHNFILCLIVVFFIVSSKNDIN